ncbi:hypothetical protein CSC3H3_05535 [Thalassospira marina]|uniref:Integrase n=1 Tax=Thalassospira marina TaxID=2048283 RepID=A0ABN5FBU9_9PROT|nr:hypothetical protein CSC3H3_05535 [Thalassospira marina]
MALTYQGFGNSVRKRPSHIFNGKCRGTAKIEKYRIETYVASQQLTLHRKISLDFDAILRLNQ